MPKKGAGVTWVPKGSIDSEPGAEQAFPRRRKRSSKDGSGHDGEEAGAAALPTLEDFRQSGWEPQPDLASASATDYYFNSYAHFGIHEDMLKDRVRTGSYAQAISGAKALFEGKTVLDVGSGTGILCLFAARAGAKRCIGIECSDIVEYARAIAKHNKLDHIVSFVHGKVEEVELPVEKVDIIISEWMGYFLIYESMLDSVLFARDKWLADGGSLFPDHAKLYLAAIEDAVYKEEKIGFWSTVWGLDLSPMQKLVIQEPVSDIVESTRIATTEQCILDTDLRTCSKEDLDFVSSYSLKVRRKDFLHGLVVWFDVSFQASRPPVIMSTAPGKPYTHWKQTVLYFTQPLVAYVGDVVSGIIAVRKSKSNPRDIDVKLSYQLEGKLGQEANIQYYRLR